MAKEQLTPAETKTMMLQVADAIIVAEPILTDADRALGDGDHGVGMERGMKAVKEALAETSDEATPGELFSTMGMAMMSSMGGASGAIFGTLFRAGKKALADCPDSFDAKGLPPPSRRRRIHHGSRRRQGRRQNHARCPDPRR